MRLDGGLGVVERMGDDDGAPERFERRRGSPATLRPIAESSSTRAPTMSTGKLEASAAGMGGGGGHGWLPGNPPSIDSAPWSA